MGSPRLCIQVHQRPGERYKQQARGCEDARARRCEGRLKLSLRHRHGQHWALEGGMYEILIQKKGHTSIGFVLNTIEPFSAHATAVSLPHIVLEEARGCGGFVPCCGNGQGVFVFSCHLAVSGVRGGARALVESRRVRPFRPIVGVVNQRGNVVFMVMGGERVDPRCSDGGATQKTSNIMNEYRKHEVGRAKRGSVLCGS